MSFLLRPFISLGLLFVVNLAYGQTPHEVVVVANASSMESISLANAYRAARGIPERNVIRLDLPQNMLDPRTYIPPEAFRQSLWQPVLQAVQQRGLNAEIKAILLSSGLPTTIAGDPPMSVQAGFYCKAGFPDAELVKSGKWVSSVFSGWVNEAPGLWKGSKTLAQLNQEFTRSMPLACASFAYTGARGNTSEELRALYSRSLAADHTAPRGSVAMLRSADVRSQARQWQIDWAANILQGRLSVYDSKHPEASERYMGVFMGAPRVDMEQYGLFVRSGSLADNLTSWGARFEEAEQTKVSEWIRHGASVAYGTVTEPYAVWTKFPHASLFVHYAQGLSALESYFQSVASPLQGFIYGDVLARPYAPYIPVRLSQKPTADGVRLSASVSTPSSKPVKYFSLYLNDRPVGPPSVEGSWQIEAEAFASGPVPARVYAHSDGAISHHGWSDITIDTEDNRPALTIALGDEVAFRIHPARKVLSWELYKGFDRIGRVAERDIMTVPADRMGWGLSEVWARGQFDTGETFQTHPKKIELPWPTSPELRIRGSPPSITETTEFVVPRSIPITFSPCPAIVLLLQA